MTPDEARALHRQWLTRSSLIAKARWKKRLPVATEQLTVNMFFTIAWYVMEEGLTPENAPERVEKALAEFAEPLPESVRKRIERESLRPDPPLFDDDEDS